MATNLSSIICAVGLHKIGPWKSVYWGGLASWARVCQRNCDYVERMGETAYERKFLGR